MPNTVWRIESGRSFGGPETIYRADIAGRQASCWQSCNRWFWIVTNGTDRLTGHGRALDLPHAQVLAIEAAEGAGA